MKKLTAKITSAILYLSLILMALPVNAQDSVWKIEMTPYLWFAGIDADIDLVLALVVDEDADAVRLIDKNDVQHIFGRWVRPDGGYILDLKEIGKDGTLKAAYFNPTPINIYRAELGRKQGAITILVELRDANYPGSTYNLIYDPQTDRLVGTYFQAVQKVSYNIEFMRSK
jgi:hypothetical protein